MTRYKVTDEWGGGEAEDADFAAFSPPIEYRALTRDGGRWFALIHVAALTEVPPPIPPEPEPGAYLLRRPGHPDEVILGHGREWVSSGGWSRWTEFWENEGGPDVAIVPLIPDPAHGVTLPWMNEEQGLSVSNVEPEGYRRVRMVDSDWAYLTRDEAEAMAGAVLAAARAARGATK